MSSLRRTARSSFDDLQQARSGQRRCDGWHGEAGQVGAFAGGGTGGPECVAAGQNQAVEHARRRQVRVETAGGAVGDDLLGEFGTDAAHSGQAQPDRDLTGAGLLRAEAQG